MLTRPNPRILAGTALLALALAACSAPGATPTSPSAATSAPSVPPDGIPHPTGADEIILRFDEGGGFVPIEFMAAHVPQFTLYGDGTVVFVRSTASVEPGADGVATGLPIRTARLTEEQIQALLRSALGDGGLGIARGEYQNPMIADAPTAVFTVNADGAQKTVSVVALGIDDQPGPDRAIRRAMGALAERLRDFDQGGSLASDAYLPAAYRGVLIDGGGGVGQNVHPWPWTTIAPADFGAPGDPGGSAMRTRRLAPDEAAAIGVSGFESGVSSGLWLKGQDGAAYSFVLRPLLPDEPE
jgi:hypothetical protein